MSDELYLQLLKKYWGYDAFRGVQLDIIRQVTAGHDTLGLMPTGGGKSITFQVASLAMGEGICIVVSPLIALMRDQVQHLRRRGIKAAALFSGMSSQDIHTTIDNCLFGSYKFLYVSPERLETDYFRLKVSHMKVCLLVVDECHCISQWGHDFRPSFLNIAELRRIIGSQVPVLALTASATPQVADDVMSRLRFARKNVVRMSFARPNLSYVVRKTEDKQGELIHILKRTPGCAIVYVRNRERTEQLASLLGHDGISAIAYHAGMDSALRQAREQTWFNGEHRVMVATNAFGMGIDKPDVRLVVHYDLPDSPEAYFQEAGRAGRDGQKAYAVALYARGDRAVMHRRMTDSFPDKDYIRSTYDDLQYYFQMAMGDGQNCRRDFDLDDFCLKFHRFPTTVDHALRLLDQAGYIAYADEEDFASRVMFTVRRDELYHLKDVQGDYERMVRALLRQYTGLFSEYAFISEAKISLRMGISVARACELLIGLSRMHVISYIPHRQTSYIVYQQPRLPSERIVLPLNVYDIRKKQYEQRIETILAYADNEDECRSRQLLRYFGEEKADDCGVCDVCIGRRTTKRKKAGQQEPKADVAERIVQLLSHAPLPPIDVVRQLDIDKDTGSAAIRSLIEEGRVNLVDGMLQVAKSS